MCINETLTQGGLSLAPPYPYMQLATLEQHGEKAARGPHGWNLTAWCRCLINRAWPAGDVGHHAEIPLERHSPETGRTEKVKLWRLRSKLNEAVAAGDEVSFSVQVSRLTFWHSYTLHAICGGCS